MKSFERSRKAAFINRKAGLLSEVSRDTEDHCVPILKEKNEVKL